MAKTKRSKKKIFVDSDLICWACFDDEGIQTHVKSEGSVSTCAACGKRRKALSIFSIAEFIYPILRDHYVPGPEEKVFDGDDDDNGRWEQQGESLQGILVEALGDEPPFLDALEEAIQDQDPATPQDGEDSYFSDANLFVERRLYPGDHFERWRDALEELQHQRRFFSGSAKALFDDLFHDVEHRKGYVEDKKISDVVHTLPMGSILFRARSFDSSEILRRFIATPGAELGPPPPHLARAGRMNPEGVPVFYGALEKDTCISELRPPLKGDVAVGEFETTRPLRLLDFRRLASGYFGLKPLSLFQPDYDQLVERRAFTRQLHRLISAPVLPGRQSDYLITQAMAEYLAHVRKPPFDGIIFQSAQREDGANVVLFPANFRDPNEEGGGQAILRYRKDSLTLHRVHGVAYTSGELSYFEGNEGELHVYDPDARPEDDDE